MYIRGQRKCEDVCASVSGTARLSWGRSALCLHLISVCFGEFMPSDSVLESHLYSRNTHTETDTHIKYGEQTARIRIGIG